MGTLTKESTSNDRKMGLTLELAKQIFTTETLSGATDLAVIRQYYHPNVRFRDAIQEVQGLDAFLETTQRFIKRCSSLEVTLNDCAQNGNKIFLQWTMKMRFSKAPETMIEGTTKLTLDSDGKVIEHRDYFDLWGDTLDGVPVVGKLYRRAVKLLG